MQNANILIMEHSVDVVNRESKRGRTGDRMILFSTFSEQSIKKGFGFKKSSLWIVARFDNGFACVITFE